MGARITGHQILYSGAKHLWALIMNLLHVAHLYFYLQYVVSQPTMCKSSYVMLSKCILN